MSADVAADHRANTDSTFAILWRGLALTPQVRAGLAGTIGLAAIGTIGKVAIPIAIQQAVDNGIGGAGGPRTSYVLGLFRTRDRTRAEFFTHLDRRAPGA